MDRQLPDFPAGVSARPGFRSDADAVLQLLQEWDRAETGEVDTDLADVLVRLPESPDDPGPTATLVWAAGKLIGAGFLAGDEGEVYVRPQHPSGAAVEQALLGWITSVADRRRRRLRMMVSAGASERQARYAAAGLVYAHSVLQYRRGLTDLIKPEWPPGLHISQWVPERDARDVHALIREAFLEVPGQPDWDWPSWSASVLERTDTDVLTVRDGDRLVGAAVLPGYDTYGHVRQLAVHRSSRGRGLGKALLLASFQHFAAQGQSEVRLGVYASNPTALHLYTEAGMTLLTEWQLWIRPE